jgi:hypothetical protein
MSVGVMKDYKLKRRNLRASHKLTLLSLYTFSSKKRSEGQFFFLKLPAPEKGSLGKCPWEALKGVRNREC